MSTSPSFAFGVEKSYQFTGVDAQPLSPKPVALEPVVRSWIEKAAALEAEVRWEKALVAALHRQVKDKDVELAASKDVCDGLSAELKTAQRAESIARNLVQRLSNKNMEFESEDEYERIAELQSTNDKLEAELREEKYKRNKLQEQHDALSTDSQRERRTKDKEIKRLDSQVISLNEAYQYQRSLFEDNEVHLNKAYAELKQQKAACKSAITARENALAAEQAAKLKVTKILAELEKRKHVEDEAEKYIEDVKAYEENNAALQQEVDDLCDKMSSLNKIIYEKDMRIARVEEELEKEHEYKRNLDVAEPATPEAVMSPINDSAAGNSLEDELNASSDFDDGFDDDDDPLHERTELLSLSPVYYVDVHPTAPVSIPDCTIAFGEHISVVPIQVAVPALCIDIEEAANTAPIVRQIKTTDSDSQTDISALTSSLVHSATISIAPIKAQKLAIATTKTSLPDSRLASLFTSSLPVIAGILSAACLYLYAEVQSWRNANGAGIGYEDAFSSGGAYGNGRKFLGLFDIAVDIGTSGFSESVARTMYDLITCIEHWTDSTYNPHY